MKAIPDATSTWVVQFVDFLNLKFPVSSHHLCLYSSVCVGPVRKSHSWFKKKINTYRNKNIPNIQLK